MPELPEVETIRLGLEKKIVGLEITNIELIRPKTFQGDNKLLQGKKVLNIWRRAKMLGIDLTSDLTLLFHLKMTGQLIFEKGKEKITGGHPTKDMLGPMPNKSTVVIFSFDDGSHLYFNDQRQFGWVKVIPTSRIEAEEKKLLGELGPEPLEKDFTWQVLKDNLLKRKKTPIKVALMDQSLIAGIGNIYTSESLFLARVDPRRLVNTITDEEFKKLHRGILDSLRLSIEKGGSTRAHFVNVDGQKGYFLDFANVYGKDGQACRGCPDKVVKITQAGRGTYFCPDCQK
ncbi:MAG: formamidopyrimidine-DNA glycosylase [Candidatus Daviesbacteria bacterium GW2011_GWA1_41_61]|uniref:Formamidopyrimidine-DNA glycosylase n=1 Tax=Candidatus Daviesbacteria bacterium GW2011_GWA2_40_9 TaxID=1618424 RepID=A0A0G0WHB2_9BACT|nr:MAG: formamidopyrimidine-DNA glycosylase [Candidatus Daviesbacteria bacterium GW2011_GWC1_40_9]KKR83715.1 MAG: formamidopyrimidine-DNA glycosylase [Candidatus Daviesbacteria bacterium GW2011_GWA2_40_9]KKR93690.1 MAG: formamidopyrimidine-DNA glycosylase [Candidatus Daviesbacteria bacterium GW2011_GWB1_41_15]KKS15156.1 MAG: formamidopyrimidine-DNA glycosylase [Candidatus Daviesbacteria bacterium GW2011_GWA1_41_61]